MTQNVLERLRTISNTIDDWKFLNSRNPHLNDLNQFQNAIQILPTRKNVEEIKNCKISDLNNEIAVLTSINTPSWGRNLGDEHFNQLRNKNVVFSEAPVIYQWNTWKIAGLVNGAKGIVKDIIYPKIRDKDSQPETIIVKFDKWSGPQFFNDPIRKNWIPLNQVSHYNANKSCTRTGFALLLNLATTVQKSQGSTFDCGIIDFGEKEIAVGMA